MKCPKCNELIPIGAKRCGCRKIKRSTADGPRDLTRFMQQSLRTRLLWAKAQGMFSHGGIADQD